MPGRSADVNADREPLELRLGSDVADILELKRTPQKRGRNGGMILLLDPAESRTATAASH